MVKLDDAVACVVQDFRAFVEIRRQYLVERRLYVGLDLVACTERNELAAVMVEFVVLAKRK